MREALSGLRLQLVCGMYWCESIVAHPLCPSGCPEEKRDERRGGEKDERGKRKRRRMTKRNTSASPETP